MGLGDDWQGWPRRPLPRHLVLCLAQALSIAGDRRIAPRIATPLELPEEPQGVTTLPVPALEEIVFVGSMHTQAAITPSPALGQHRRVEVAKDGILTESFN